LVTKWSVRQEEQSDGVDALIFKEKDTFQNEDV